jgi:3-deoxy-D-manno-octulosonic-acid transferase
VKPLPPGARFALVIYNLFFPLVFLVLLPGYLLRMMRRGGYGEKFGQRFGRYSSADRERFASRRWLWIHSISVGETFIALKIARALHERDPSIGILLSTTTSTGFAEARKAAASLGDWLEPIYNPLDAPWIVRRALDILRPAQLILIEGEVWPNLVSQCRARSIPVVLVDARLSPRSERRFQRFRSITGPIFRLLDRICVSDPADVLRWEACGARAAQIITTGSIKFDNPAITTSREAEFRALLALLGVKPDDPIIVAGSTWAPEEKLLVSLLPRLQARFPGIFLIIVPRHYERTDSIIRDLAPLTNDGLRIARRSSLPAAASERAEVLIVDATGELRDWYALATVVFVGKTMPGIAEVGGQNPAEPAVLGKPIVVGPHTGNFATLMAHLRRREAILEVPDADGLEAALVRLLQEPSHRAHLAQSAREALQVHAAATARTAALLLPTSC